MICEFLPYGSVQPQRARDLTRLLKYLFLPQTAQNCPFIAFETRLLGAPLTRNLVQTVVPWGETAPLAADHLALQMERFCRAALRSRGLGHIWFNHVVVSLTDYDGASLSERLLPGGARGSRAAALLEIAELAVTKLGGGQARPSVWVPHCDTDNLHAHGIIVEPDASGQMWGAPSISPGLVGKTVLQLRDELGLAQIPPHRVVRNESSAIQGQRTKHGRL